MLDLTVFFLVAGFFFGAAIEPARGKDEKAQSAGERERMRLKLALDRPPESADDRRHLRPQLIAGAVFFVVGILYALSIPGINLAKLLPCIALGLLAGAVVRMGLRTMSAYFLAFGAVFLILPFLLSQGVGMFKNFQKIKVGPWFEADIKSTETPKSIEFKVQDVLDRSQAGANPLDKEQYSIARKNAMIDHAIDREKISHSRWQAPSNNLEEYTPSHPIDYFSNSEFCNTKGYLFIEEYIHEIISEIQVFQDISYSTENKLRDALEPFVSKAAYYIDTNSKNKVSPDAFGKSVSDTLGKIEGLRQQADISPSKEPASDEVLNATSTSGPSCLKDDSRMSSEGIALPHILVSRLYRRIGNDRKALQVLNSAAGILKVPDKDRTQEGAREPALEDAQQARLLIERGTLRRALGEPGWDKDWRRAADFWKATLDDLDGWSGSCGKDCGDIHKARTHLRYDLAQLRNQYVFSLIQDPDRRRSENFDPNLMDDAVRWAKQNYKNIKELLELKALTDPGDKALKPCIEAFYPDTYALALMARNSYTREGDQNDDKDMIYYLLEKALDAADKDCSSIPQDMKSIIRQHQKLANNLFDN